VLVLGLTGLVVGHAMSPLNGNQNEKGM
jgi:hypothetical protein